MPDDVIIFGGHGKVALHLSRILSDRGYQVSAVFRNPDHTDEVAGTGARPAVGSGGVSPADYSAAKLEAIYAESWLKNILTEMST